MQVDEPSSKPFILISIRYYLPGFRSGGPVRSISNLVEAFGNEYNFLIVTSDRDYLSSSSYPFPKMLWIEEGKSKIIYLPPSRFNFVKILKILQQEGVSLIYVNSFFDRQFSFSLLLLKCILGKKLPPLLCAPRGEFFDAALVSKRMRKRLYIGLFKIMKLSKKVDFHATSTSEVKTIIKNFDQPTNIHLAKNIVHGNLFLEKLYAVKKSRKRAPFRVAFMARIHPKKNLDFAIKRLLSQRFPIQFNIYGPVDDQNYWNECRSLIDSAKSNLKILHHGAVPHQQVLSVLNDNDLFLFPTKGENFGHVICEALLAGLPVITSDQTPWNEIEKSKLGWCIDLARPDIFEQKIQEVASWNKSELHMFRSRLSSFCDKHFALSNQWEASEKMFREILG